MNPIMKFVARLGFMGAILVLYHAFETKHWAELGLGFCFLLPMAIDVYTSRKIANT